MPRPPDTATPLEPTNWTVMKPSALLAPACPQKCSLSDQCWEAAFVRHTLLQHHPAQVSVEQDRAQQVACSAGGAHQRQIRPPM